MTMQQLPPMGNTWIVHAIPKVVIPVVTLKNGRVTALSKDQSMRHFPEPKKMPVLLGTKHTSLQVDELVKSLQNWFDNLFFTPSKYHRRDNETM